ncbi:hypothetical protein EUGRSUZ_K01690 [Eucalyptus grandis]|uniref:Uncharacterized protein n=2 Tax=Eucalyptus grandis TaxID=71139 RepID=A0ACC3IUT0_EUCGR|nr:hypothetical protein EUGRSUZ_K01690 [Eucalyptus grandis]
MSPLVSPTALKAAPLALLPSSTSSFSPSRPAAIASSSWLSLWTKEPTHCHLKYIRTFSSSMILPAKRRAVMLIKLTDVEETAQNDGEYYSDSDIGDFPFDTCWLDAKLQLKLEQKMRMKVPKRIRLRRKKLVRKRRMRKKGRWPPSKMK